MPPLPPHSFISRLQDRSSGTVFGEDDGSVAAPRRNSYCRVVYGWTSGEGSASSFYKVGFAHYDLLARNGPHRAFIRPYGDNRLFAPPHHIRRPRYHVGSLLVHRAG